MKRVIRLFITVMTMLLLSASMVLAVSSVWLLKTWNNLTVDELLFHMKTNLKGTNPQIIHGYLLNYLLPVVIIIVAFVAAVIALRRKKKAQNTVLIIALAVSIAGFVFTAVRLNTKLNIADYIEKNSQESEFIAENYVDPAETDLVFPEQKRNLIYIYLESAEMTYSDSVHGGAFEQNVIPELTDLGMDNECFAGNSNQLNGGISLPGSTYTMGALFAQSSGLPLKTGLSVNDMDTQEQFFPSVTTIGDVLEDNGYTNELLIGSRATFGGRELFFDTHGSYSIFDFDYAVDEGLIPASYFRWWGFEDEKLFLYARSELTRLAASGEPFNLTLLTVDTHFEDGYVCDLCGDTFGDDRYSNVFACSSAQVAGFVRWIQQQPFYENTTIVIAGDHPTMDSDYCGNVDEEYRRRVYTCFINSAAEPVNPDRIREYSTMDMFPTTLAAMGVEIEGDRLGLGTNLFSGSSTLLESYGYDMVRSELLKKSDFLNSLNSIDITDTLINRISTRSDVYVGYDGSSDERHVNVYVDTYTKLTASALIERLEVEISVNGGEPEIFTLSDFQADGNIYYIEDAVVISESDEVSVRLYMVGTDGERYFLNDTFEVDNTVLEDPNTVS